ncbi:hypothetical protein GCM10027344_32020 [Spelaeicoccus albus]
MIRGEGLPALIVEDVDVHRLGTGGYRCDRVRGDLVRGVRHRRMYAIPVERCLYELYRIRHTHQNARYHRQHSSTCRERILVRDGLRS